MQVSLNKRNILPTVYKKDDKVYFSTTVFTPVRYNIRFGAGMMPEEQIKAVFSIAQMA